MSTPTPALVVRDPATHIILSRGESIGVLFDSLAGIASTLAAIAMLALIFRGKNGENVKWEAILISVIALFAGEVIMGIGHTLSLKWVIESRVYTGMYCTVQGVLRQLGPLCLTLATLNIAVQTFLTIWWLKFLDKRITIIVLALELLFSVLWVAVGYGMHHHPQKEFYAAPTPYWCWIGKGYRTERIVGEYLWYWLTLLISFALYPPLFLLHRKMIKPGTRWYSPSSVWQQEGDECKYMDSSPARRTLWYTILYPVIYGVLVLPLSIIRWINFSVEAKTGQSHHWPVATFVAITIFTLSGVFNAILYRLTRKRFFQHHQREIPTVPPVRVEGTIRIFGGSD